MKLSLPRAARLLLPLIAASGLALFLYLADEIREGESWRLDKAILLALRRPENPAVPIGPKWLEQSAIDVSALGGFTIVWWLSVAIIVYLYLNRHKLEAALLASAFIGAALLNAGLKAFFDRPRPDLVPHLASVSNASFPSGHAMISAATYLTLGVLLAHGEKRRRVRIYIVGLAIAITVVVGLSRLYLGVHWPSDVLAGWCVGAAWALGFSTIARAFNPSGGETETVIPPVAPLADDTRAARS